MKGQATIISLIFFIVMLIMYGSMLPVLNGAITDFLPSADPATAALLQLIPVIILILIIGSIWQSGREGG